MICCDKLWYNVLQCSTVHDNSVVLDCTVLYVYGDGHAYDYGYGHDYGHALV